MTYRCFFFFKQKTAYEMRISDWSSDVCSSDLADYHPEVDSLVHTLMCVDVAARSGFELPVRYAALVHDLGKAKTPSGEWPSHRMHDARGVPLVEAFSARLRVPSACRDLAVLHTREHLLIHRVLELRRSEEHPSELQSLMPL